MSENLYWVWLSRKCRYDSGSLDRLLRVFSSARQIYEAGEEALRRVIGNSSKSDFLRLCDKDLSDAQRIMDYCMMTDVGILTYHDPRYPARLRMLPDAPPVLYYKGKLPTFEGRLAMAVVGTRKMSEYGKHMAFEIAHDLARAGAILVTGMALGIDGVASAAAVAVETPSIAVLGSGIDIIYPREHQYLMHGILQNGVVMTEFAPGTPPEKGNFPRRNRIISGLSQGVLVIEGDRRSGALITANHAEKQGRDVFALPGNADEVNSEATNLLLKNGAHLVSCADDIIKVYEPLYGNTLNMLRLLTPDKIRMDKTLASLRVSARPYFPKYKTSTDEFGETLPRKRKTEKLKKKENIKAEPPKQEEVTPPPVPSDEDKVKLLDPGTLAVYRTIKPGMAFTVDEICENGFSAAEVLSAMTILEIHKCVMALPGGRYTRL